MEDSTLVHTQADAASYCRGLGLDGYTDWRLPTRIELVSIIDLGTSYPAIDGTAFPNTTGQFFWSSSSYTPDPSEAWGVDFGIGVTWHSSTSALAHIRCVR